LFDEIVEILGCNEGQVIDCVKKLKYRQSEDNVNTQNEINNEYKTFKNITEDKKTKISNNHYYQGIKGD